MTIEATTGKPTTPPPQALRPPVLPSPVPPRRAWWARDERTLAFAGPALFTALFTSIGITHNELWGDEHATWWMATLPMEDMRRVLGHVDVVMTPYYLFIRAWIAVFGDSPLALRMPSLLAMAFAAGGISLLGRRLFAVRVGVTAGLLFAVLPSVSQYAQETRGYALAVAGSVLATLLLLRAVDRGTPAAWTLYATAVTLTGWSHLVALLVLTPHAVVAWRAFRRGDRATLRHWLTAATAAAALSAPFALLGLRQTAQIGWVDPTWQSIAALWDQLAGAGTASGMLLGSSVVAIVAWRRNPHILLLTTWMLVPPALLFLGRDIAEFFYFRYMLFTMPAVTLLAAVGFWSALGALAARSPSPVVAYPPHKPARRSDRHFGDADIWSWAGVLCLVVLILFTSAGAHMGIRQAVQGGEDDFRAAAYYLRARQQPGDAIAYTVTNEHGWSERRAMAYELRNSQAPRDVFVGASAASVGRFTGTDCVPAEQCVAGVRRLWLIDIDSSADPLAKMPADQGAAVRARFRPLKTTRFAGVHVSLWEAK